ncbi:hypothetical protein M431DRAFT_476586 [Trichoderma harzianum CBS 226.95]|uniref:Nephrocystin 3-like N-terminal domain-containing protein n=1 Tax=Trichoderma harzianum CBS 226.95 TaxID=983964 RepID=A0A2T4ASJ7_TRIHA|nr:hypothetical protein M431DRAFT_476586 [Trichoderma harzianum CBS 226.95]PTB60044.1 hypothetical protein M431DRAFT_476586 [Trichoderma harzianum CBS 226.95]
MSALHSGLTDSNKQRLSTKRLPILETRHLHDFNTCFGIAAHHASPPPVPKKPNWIGTLSLGQKKAMSICCNSAIAMADRDLYTVGWICAIHTELVAALALLDERHDCPKELDPNDSNNYELGKISNHYVTIACLPDGEHGIAAAAGAAINLLRSFPNIRFGLMVGTGGGAPTSHHDIRLGDVVVSTPGDGKGGVFQYDFGKTMQNQAFVETGFLDQPPRLLRTAVAGLKASYEMDGHTLTEEVNNALQRKPRLKKTYSRPQTGDILYKSTFTHISRQWEACEACDDDPSNYISRRPRDENDDDPTIHYGLIASANQRLTDQMSELTFNTDKIAHKLDLAKLSIAEGAEYGSYADQHENECLQGTRTKILHDIDEWATSLSRKCIFWLNGMAGTGKSTISRTIAKTLRGKDLLGASFFFKKGEADRGNATRFFSTIASQLQTRVPGMADHLRKVIDSESQISTKSLKEQFKRLILEPISSLKAANNQPSFLVVVVDALDECDNDKDIKVILDLIPQLQASSSVHFRVFITSRPELPIRLGFKKMEENDYQDLILHQIPKDDIEYDIQFFLKSRLAEIRESRMLPEEWPGETNIHTLTTISIPLFIFAATMCRVFEDHDMDPRKCLEDYLKHEAEDSKLDAIYLPVLNRICTKYSDTDGRKDQFIEDVREVVSAVMLLESPLSITKLSVLMGIPTKAINSRLNSLHSVLNVPKDENKPIRLFHLSFRDFLLDHKTPAKTAIWIDKKATNQKLAIQCLNIMRTHLKKNLCNLPNYAVSSNNIPDETVSQHLSQPLEYSCRYWVEHLVQGQGPVEDSQSFLEIHLLHWVEAMAILKCVPELIKALTYLQLFIQDNGDDQVSEFLLDAIRYVLRNERMIKKRPLQLYVSGLIFAPAVYWGAELGELQNSFDPVCSAISSTGCVLAAGFSNMTMRFWDTITGNLITGWRAGESDRIPWIQAIAFSSDDKLLAVCLGGSGKLQICDSTKGTLHSTFDEDVGRVTSLVFTDGGQVLASPSKSWDFLTWDHATGIQRHLLTRRLSEDAHVALSPTGLLLAAFGCYQTEIELWNLATCSWQCRLAGHAMFVSCITFSTDGRLIASGDRDGTIIIWDVATGVQRQHITNRLGSVFGISFSPEGQRLALLFKRQGSIVVWDLSENRSIQILGDKSRARRDVLFYRDNKTLASIGGLEPIRLWDATDVSQKSRQPHASQVKSVVFSPDGQLLATVCRRVLIWMVTSESIIQNLGDIYHGNILTFSPSNTLLAFSSSPTVIKLWNINTEMQQSSIDAFGEVRCIAFSSDDQLVACLVDLQDINVWDLTTGTLRNIISDFQYDPHIRSINFSFNSEYLATYTLFPHPDQPKWLIKAFRLVNTDIADFYFWAPDAKAHFSRDHVNRVHDVPVFEFGTPQVDLNGVMVSEGNDERTNDVQTRLVVYGEWLYYQGEKVVWLPDSRRASCWASNNKTIAIGHDSGGVTIIKISPQSGRGEFHNI